MLVNSTNRPPQPTNIEQAAQNDGRVSKTVANDDRVSANLSPNISRKSIRSRAARSPTHSERKGLFSALGSCFGRRSQSRRQQISSPATATTSPANNAVDALLQGRVHGLIIASTSGILVAKENAAKGLAAAKSSSEVASFFNSGDKALRRGTTALRNVADMVSFRYLSEAEKQKMPAGSLETLEKQSTQIVQMVDTVRNSTFRDSTQELTQYGTSSKGYTEALEKYPEQDHAIRAWVQNGLNLGTELINIQEQILCQGRVQSESYISDLQSRVDAFATSTERDALDPVDINVAGSFADEVLEQTSQVSKE